MNASATGAPHDPASRPLAAMTGHLVALGVGLVALGLVFRQEVVSAVQVWEASTAYNHCFLIIPISLYLIWDRKETLVGLVPQPVPWVALAGLPVGAAWLVAERLGIMEGRQLMALTLAQLLILAVLGWRLWFAILGPLLYLYFLVPFGEFLTPKLQDITAIFIRHGLEILQIPAYIDGYTIEIPEGVFYVAEACAGLRFLIASIAFGVLYALMMYRTPMRRAVFIVVSIVVPIIANGFRALGIVVLGHVLGSAEAGAADHVIYGWIFFSFVILILILIGLPFRQDTREERRPMPVPAPVPGPVASAWAAAIAVSIVGALSPGVAVGLDRVSDSQIAAVKPVVPNSGCEIRQMTNTEARSDRRVTTRVVCGLTPFDITVMVFPARTTAGPVIVARRRLSRPLAAEDISESWLEQPDGTQTPWRIVKATDPNELSAVGVWLDGKPISLGLGMRMRMAQASLFGGSSSPVVVAVQPVVDWPAVTPNMQRDIGRVLTTFLLAHPELAEQASRLGALAKP
ncbi:MAG: exosortase A [Acetobacteraceae bacterium]